MPKIRKIKEFTRPELKRLDEDIDKHLEQIGKKFGIHLKRGSGRFSPDNFSFKIEASIIGKDGTVATREAKDFERYAKMYGLNPKDLGKTFEDWDGKEFEIVGLTTRSPKYPILAKNTMNGKTFKFSEKQVQQALAKSTLN
jgi:hypothetical protein